MLSIVGHHYATLFKIHVYLIALIRQVYKEIKLIAVMLMTSSKTPTPKLKMITRDFYWNDEVSF